MTDLNRQQRTASLPAGGVSLVVAGAGTGKTKTLVEKIKNVIASGKIRPGNMLVLTFSRKAAEEIKERIKAHAGEQAESITSGTFHSFCLRLLRENSGAFIISSGFDRFPRILDEQESRRLKLDIIKESLEMFLGLPLNVFYGLSENIEKYENKTIKKLKRLGIIKHLNDINNSFTERKRKECLIDYGDMMRYAIALLNSDMAVREKIVSRYRYIFVDEFQDTSTDNYMLLNLLLPERNPNLFLVGDDWQSIYGFRGSQVDYIIRARRFFPSVKIHKMSLNYRSRKEIVDLSNKFVRNNRYKTRKKLKSNKGRGGVISGHHVINLNHEIKVIRDILTNGAADSGDIAILYRNNWQGDLISKNIGDIIDGRAGSIKMMTMHSSKGLEFDTVIIAGVSDDIIPDQSNDIEEERRLLYVALTRARERLHVIHHECGADRLSVFAKELGFKAD
ncbi:MAG: ATP-dependent helicase [Spirochaetes bacterium]|nr:ATP-dependent helicase [Spirochaetota bacterium]